MKRLLGAILCVIALVPFAFGATVNRNLQEKPAQEQTDKKAYDIYVGQYDVQQKFVLTVTNEDGKLMGQPTGDVKAEFKAEETPDTFFSSAVDAHLKFARSDKNEITGVVVTINGKDFWAKKIK
jgi:hypothetical protein